jgi:hypothetical protein
MSDLPTFEPVPCTMMAGAGLIVHVVDVSQPCALAATLTPPQQEAPEPVV